MLFAVLLPAALVVSLVNNLASSWAVLAFIAVLYGPVLWLTVLLHELGHCLATKRGRAVLNGRSCSHAYADESLHSSQEHSLGHFHESTSTEQCLTKYFIDVAQHSSTMLCWLAAAGF